jgi:hypothetical protein
MYGIVSEQVKSAVTLLTCIRQVRVSNLPWDSAQSDWILMFCTVLALHYYNLLEYSYVSYNLHYHSSQMY